MGPSPDPLDHLPADEVRDTTYRPIIEVIDEMETERMGTDLNLAKLAEQMTDAAIASLSPETLIKLHHYADHTMNGGALMLSHWVEQGIRMSLGLECRPY